MIKFLGPVGKRDGTRKGADGDPRRKLTQGTPLISVRNGKVSTRGEYVCKAPAKASTPVVYQRGFRNKDLGEVNICLGIEFKKTKSGYNITQKGYINDILKKFNMEDCKPVSTPMESGMKLIKSQDDKNQNKYPYREIVGSLMYLAVATRPDIAYCVSALSQFNNCYNETHWKAAKRVLRYLKGTQDQGISYSKDNKNIEGYVDSDWGNCLIDRRSYTGYVFVHSDGAVSWESRKQQTVALSSTEAEYMGITEVTKKLFFYGNFYLKLDLKD